jgi:hypothetical protein
MNAKPRPMGREVAAALRLKFPDLRATAAEATQILVLLFYSLAGYSFHYPGLQQTLGDIAMLGFAAVWRAKCRKEKRGKQKETGTRGQGISSACAGGLLASDRLARGPEHETILLMSP